MSGKEIQNEVQKAGMVIDQMYERIKNLRSICPHENVKLDGNLFIGSYKLCLDCGKAIYP